MLGKVVAIEQKELELTRQQLIIEDAENQKQLKECEDKILHLLKNAEGNILGLFITWYVDVWSYVTGHTYGR